MAAKLPWPCEKNDFVLNCTAKIRLKKRPKKKSLYKIAIVCKTAIKSEMLQYKIRLAI